LKSINVALISFFLVTSSVFFPLSGIASESTPPDRVGTPAGTGAKPPAEATGFDVPSGIRAVVFSPHPDDETLAAGGLIQRILEKGGKVRVVFMTNGDGYLEGVRKESGEVKVMASDFVNYGIKRQEEALKAISHLGIKQRQALFLGFPDQGLDHLWRYWTSFKPYTSPYTHLNSCSYRSSYMRLKYAGGDLEKEIEHILQDFKPDWVIIPDPRDLHPDHAATGVFVLDSLRRFDREERISLQKTEVFTYLVHYRDYPDAGMWRKWVAASGIGSFNIAAKELSGSQWLDFAMTPEELSKKRLALNSYPSQMEVLGGLMRRFIRPVEIFGRLNPAQVIEVPAAYEKQLGPFPGTPKSRPS